MSKIVQEETISRIAMLQLCGIFPYIGRFNNIELNAYNEYNDVKGCC